MSGMGEPVQERTAEEPATGRPRRRWESAVVQTVLFVLIDAVIIVGAVTAAYAARFEGAVPPEWALMMPLTYIVALGVFLILFWLLRSYRVVWRYAGVDVLMRLGVATLGATALLLAIDVVSGSIVGLRPTPISVVLLTGVFTFLGAATIRSIGRIQVHMSEGTHGSGSRVLIVGAGDAGSLLLRDIASQPRLGYRVVGFLDDDPRKIGRSVRGTEVLAGIEALPEIVERERIDEVFVAAPAATVAERRRILDLCNTTSAVVRIVPGIALALGDVAVSQLRPVSIEDLLGRDPVDIDVAGIAESLAGRAVAVTGAAGSIGSELCRQIMSMRPRSLLLLEIDETRLYETYLELRKVDPFVPLMCVCDIRNETKVSRILAEHQVDVVFHAAAYKHVPLMELAPDEAIATNVGGTRSVLRACQAAGVDHFVLISTDKAVKPASVMGATKALAERIAIKYARDGVRISVVRFGNVLGSRGSVVPLFEEQLRDGGPVRVTDPEVTRYFMTISEAARLVLQAQALSDGGELYILEMGEPVRIVDLARKMISLSGAKTEIVFDGLRPGEKLHEALVHDDQSLRPTECVAILRLDALPCIEAGLDERVESLLTRARGADQLATIRELMALVHDYVPAPSGDR